MVLLHPFTSLKAQEPLHFSFSSRFLQLSLMDSQKVRFLPFFLLSLTENHKINTAILEHKAAKGRHLWVVVWSPLVHSFCKCFQLGWERPAPAQLLRTDLPLTAGGTESFTNAGSTRIHMTLKYFFGECLVCKRKFLHHLILGL